MTQFKISPWNITFNYQVCSVFLYHGNKLYQTQIRFPKDMELSDVKKYDAIQFAKEKLYQEAEKGRKGFEPIKRGGVDAIDSITFEEEDRRKEKKNQIIL